MPLRASRSFASLLPVTAFLSCEKQKSSSTRAHMHVDVAHMDKLPTLIKGRCSKRVHLN